MDTTCAAAEFANTGAAPAQRWIIGLVQPPGYVHSAALFEVAETLLHGLQALGMQARFGSLAEECDALLIFGAHLLPPDFKLPAHAIIYNLEQLVDWSRENAASPYFERLKQHEVWDYSEVNMSVLREQGHERAKHVPLGYAPQLARIAHARQDIDVLFYGSMNERRQQIIVQLKAKGLKVETLFGVYGEQRDRVIARAKVVLNMHYYPSGTFEIARVSYLLANRKAVVCEHSAMTPAYAHLSEAMAYVPYEELVSSCARLVADETQRKALELRAFECFIQRPQPALLATALGLSPPAPHPASGKLPTTLHLGSGKDFRQDHLNVDIDPFWQPDLLMDFGGPLPWGDKLATERFGDFRLTGNLFEILIANDVLEHIPNLVRAMTNAITLLRPGGEFHISVCYDLSLGAWQDPTHVRAFNENSWLYYTDWFWYLGWDEARFDLVQQGFQLSEMGQQLMKKTKDLPLVLRTPRAVDSMTVRLRKRYLSASEISALKERRARVKAAPSVNSPDAS
ncbi:methyltransferase domain-containing protein [Ottowia testudinis]|uniref:Methyltransferase domain-containing protein n=1 Tax=Ottowia testudinis TaxID=2816950 RepID=A0A975CIQ0_9BURK|nr:methyltransferase domain-containing protein [Ottowia testudinis]QTD45821.1 methyltransferase domain-containing protein [Ottowia testudinis]